MFLEADTEIYSLQRAYYSSHTILGPVNLERI